MVVSVPSIEQMTSAISVDAQHKNGDLAQIGMSMSSRYSQNNQRIVKFHTHIKKIVHTRIKLPFETQKDK